LGFFKNRSFLVKIVKDDPEDDTPPEEVDVVDVITDHVKRHRIAYLLGSSAVIAGAVFFVTRGSYSGELPPSDGIKHIIIRPFSIFSRQNVITVIAREGRGHPGYIVRCKETGEIFLSQAEAAKSVGTIPITMSRHLRGNISHIYGLHFERLTP